jgi:hypothetical protein
MSLVVILAGGYQSAPPGASREKAGAQPTSNSIGNKNVKITFFIYVYSFIYDGQLIQR